MPLNFTRQRGLTFLEVARRLKLTDIQFQGLLKRNAFPGADELVNGQPVWSERTVQAFLAKQPR